MAPIYPELQDRVWLREQYTQLGRSVRDIAAGLGCGPGAVHAALKRHRIARRDPGLPPGQGRQPLELPPLEELRREIAATSLSAVADRLGVARSTIYRRINNR